MIFFTADTHFNHANIINFCKRPFSDVIHMNETIIKNWNSKVNYDDEIYILGDITISRSGLEANKILERLNGKKYLIKGNHDVYIDDIEFNESYFEWIKDYYVLDYQKCKFILTLRKSKKMG